MLIKNIQYPIYKPICVQKSLLSFGQNSEDKDFVGKKSVDGSFEKYDDSIATLNKVGLSLQKNKEQQELWRELSSCSQFYKQELGLSEEEFLEFFKKFDVQKLRKQNPLFKKYKTRDWQDFFIIHNKMGTKDFSSEGLKCPKNLTEMLKGNYHAGYLYCVLNAFPQTDRRIGEIPANWFDNCEKNEKTETKVRELFEDFNEKMHGRDDLSWEERKKNMQEFSEKLGTVLNKKVAIKSLGSGCYGTGYKVEIDGAKPVVMKIYHREINTYFTLDHGPWAEVPRGLFLNRYPNNFVHFYFGTVAHKHSYDAYSVTEFLPEDEKFVKPQSEIKDKDYSIYCSDLDADDNSRQGKVYDYGGVYIFPQEKTITYDSIVEYLKS